MLSPGKGDEVVSREGAVLDREKFESYKDEYYSLRGWASTLLIGAFSKGTSRLVWKRRWTSNLY